MTVKKFLSTEWTLNSKQFLKVHLKLTDQFWLLTQHWNGIYQLQTALPKDLRATSWVGWLQTIKKKNHKLVYTQTHTHRPDSYRTQKTENTSFSIQIVSHLTAIWQNINFCFIDYTKAFDCVDHTNCGKFWKKWEYQTTWPASWKVCIQVKKQQLELDMKQHTGSKSGKKYVKVVYGHPAYWTYM